MKQNLSIAFAIDKAKAKELMVDAIDSGFACNKQDFCPPNSKFLRRRIQVAVNEKIRIKIKGYEHAVVDAAAVKIVEAVKRSGAQVSGPIPLPTDKEIITILRAVHKYKYSREQFEMRTHKRLIVVIRPTKETVASLENLELPAGVNIVMETK